jgi:signal transduction histidine kinase/ActR/RegA family two-component response regulator
MPVRFFKSILFKIAASILLLEAVALIVLAVIYTRKIHQDIDRYVRGQITLLGMLVYENKLDRSVIVDPTIMGRFFNRDFVRMEDGMVIDSEGRILVSDDSSRLGLSAFDLRMVNPVWLTDRFLKAGGVQALVSDRPSRAVCITAIRPRNGEKGRLFSVLKVDLQPAGQIKAKFARYFAAGTAAAVLLTWLTILAAFRLIISRRIGSLIAMLQRVEKGDLNARVKGIVLPDEIGLIQRHMNAIVSQLQETIQVLEKRLFDLKESEIERERIQTQFFQVQKMEALGVLTGGVAHDFNNLLTAIQGCADMALLRIDESDSAHQDIKEIQHASRRASDLTRQLLLFSHKQPMIFTAVNLNRVIDDLYKMLHRLIGEEIGISMPVELDLWTNKADRSCLEQVITNLVVNAKDAMKQGGLLTIRTENVELTESQCLDIPNSRPGLFVRLTVADTGTGMESEVLEHIFEPFFTTKESGKGTGLGLSVVYGIVEQHNGFIRVTSRVGQGSAFEIYLPAVREKAEDKAEPVHPDLEILQGRGERILIVEDETGVREYLRTALTRNGYNVDVASKANEALDRFEKRKKDFHLVFSDVVLPDRNGVELVEELLKRKPGLAVILSSGYTERRSWWNLIEEKKYPYLQKPYRMVQLLKIIRVALDDRKGV